MSTTTLIIIGMIELFLLVMAVLSTIKTIAFVNAKTEIFKSILEADESDEELDEIETLVKKVEL